MTTATPILRLPLRFEHDVVLARQRARQAAELLGFDGQDATRIATAVSEIARNAFAYASGAAVDYRLETEGLEQLLVVEVTDRGPGIPDVQRVLDGSYRSASGSGSARVSRLAR